MSRKKRNRSSETPKPAQGGTVPAAAPNRRAGIKLWLFRIAAIVIAPVLCLLLAEGVLRLAQYGYPTRFLLNKEWHGKEVLRPNLRFGWRFFGAAPARQPAPFMMAAEKPANTIRVFVFGESAAFGDPQPDFGLPRMLQTLLRLRYPTVEFEVVNAAMTGINSHVILPIARDCARAQGDIWVIYMGNNEVVGPYGPGSVFGLPAPPLPVIRSSLALKSTRLGQWLDAWRYRLNPPPENREDWGGMQMFLEHRVRQDDARLRRVYHHFTRNLEDLLELGRENQVGVVLSTVAVNLGDCAPFASAHRPGLSKEDQRLWQSLFEQGAASEAIQSWQETGKPLEEGEARRQTGVSVSLYEQAARIDDHYAELHYRRARCCLALGQAAKARQHFERALDLDTLRFRCDRRLNQIIRETAARRAGGDLRLADAEAAFARESPHGIPGRHHFLEHVHFTFEGNYLLAITLARQLEALLPEPARGGGDLSRPWPSLEACSRQLGYQAWDRYGVAAEVLSRLYDPPFVQQLNHAEQVRGWQGEMERLRPELQAATLRQSEVLCREAIAAAPEDWVLHSHLTRIRQQLGDLPGALEAARRVVELLPLGSAPWQQLGILQMQRQNYEEALDSLCQAVRADPDNFWALEKLGRCQAAQGDHPEAIKTFRQALALKPRFGPAYLGLGRSLEALGRSGEAEANYQLALQHRVHRKAELVELMEFCRLKGWNQAALTNCLEVLRMNPGDALLHLSAGQILTALNRDQEAQRHYTEAMRLDAGLAPARFLAGLQLGRQGDAAGAAQHFQEVLRLMPDLAEARLNLGIALAKLGRAAEARQQFQEVLRRQPTNAVARREIQALEERSPAPN